MIEIYTQNFTLIQIIKKILEIIILIKHDPILPIRKYVIHLVKSTASNEF